MLTPEQIQSLSDHFLLIAQPINQFLIKDISRRVSEAGQLTSSAAYQIYRAQQLGMSQKEIKEKIKKELKIADKTLELLLTQSAEVGYNFDIKRFSPSAIPFSENTGIQKTVQAAINLAKEDFSNLTQTLGMVDPFGNPQSLQSAYQKTMDFAFEQVFTGAADYNTAISNACKNIARYGVRVIDYESGVHTSLEAATRRNMMGGLGLMQEQISQQNHDDLGANGWEISAHAASAPDHEPIQGKQYTDEEYQAINGRLRRRIGTLNCGHVAFPIILGSNSPQYSSQQLEEFRRDNEKGVDYEGRHFKTVYEATQYQRQIERAIRLQKNKKIVAESTGNETQKQSAKIKLKRLNAEYKHFSAVAGFPMINERLKVFSA